MSNTEAGGSNFDNLTMEFARQIYDIKYSELGEGIREKTRMAILDFIGCAIYGSKTPWSQSVVDYVRELSSKQSSTIFLNHLKTDPADAALSNGTMAHSFELDDVFMEGKMHPGAPVISASFSLGESIGADGKSILEAVVAGYEAMGRVGIGLGANAAKTRGWHITGVCGPFGAAAAAGKLLNLSPEVMANAFGIAGTQSSGLFAFTADGSMTKRFHPGKAAQSGIMAALLAKKGFKGPTKILEAKDGGFLKAFSDSYDFDKILRKPEEKMVIQRTGFKLYSCCGSIHSALDAIRILMEKNGARESQVMGLEIGVSSVVRDQCGWEYEPLGTLQAQMSLKFCAATMVREGNVFVDQFVGNKINDAQTIELANKVKVYIDEDSNKVYPKKNPARVTIKFDDNTDSTVYVDEPKGLSEKYFVKKKDIEDKFNSLTGSIIGRENSQELISYLDKLDSTSDISEVMELLA